MMLAKIPPADQFRDWGPEASAKGGACQVPFTNTALGSGAGQSSARQASWAHISRGRSRLLEALLPIRNFPEGACFLRRVRTCMLKFGEPW